MRRYTVEEIERRLSEEEEFVQDIIDYVYSWEPESQEETRQQCILVRVFAALKASINGAWSTIDFLEEEETFPFEQREHKGY